MTGLFPLPTPLPLSSFHLNLSLQLSLCLSVLFLPVFLAVFEDYYISLFPYLDNVCDFFLYDHLLFVLLGVSGKNSNIMKIL